MKKHFVTFFSPGTFVAEQSEYPIDSWDTDKAMEIARGVKERYSATPYGFRFTTRERGDDDLDSKVVKTSPMYYLGGEIVTLAQLKKRADPHDDILISNMECNHWDKIVVNTNSWKWVQPLEKEDVILSYKA